MTVCVNKSVNLIGKEKLRRTCFLNPVSVEPKWHFLQNVIAATLAICWEIARELEEGRCGGKQE